MDAGVNFKGRALVATDLPCALCKQHLHQLLVRFVKNDAEHLDQFLVCRGCDYITGVNPHA